MAEWDKKDQPGHYLQVLPDFKEMGVPDGKMKMLIISDTIVTDFPQGGVLFHLIELPRHGDLSFGKGNKRRLEDFP